MDPTQGQLATPSPSNPIYLQQEPKEFMDVTPAPETNKTDQKLLELLKRLTPVEKTIFSLHAIDGCSWKATLRSLEGFVQNGPKKVHLKKSDLLRVFKSIEDKTGIRLAEVRRQRDFLIAQPKALQKAA